MSLSGPVVKTELPAVGRFDPHEELRSHIPNSRLKINKKI